MDQRLMLIKAITLLYRESQLVEKTENSSDLVRQIIETVKLPEAQLTISTERNILSQIRDTAVYMSQCPLTHIHDKHELLQRLKMNCDSDDRLYDAFTINIEPDLTQEELKRTIISLTTSISTAFKQAECWKIIAKAYIETKFESEKIRDFRSYVQTLISKLEPFQDASNRDDPAIVSEVSFSDLDKVAEVFSGVKDSAEGTSLMVTGWQGLNRMLQGGFRRGECWAFSALQHNYKTGFSLTLFKQIAVYNKPVLINPAKKPMLLRISFEDSIEGNLQFLYQNLYENEHGCLPDIKCVTAVEMATYVKEKMEATGFTIKMLRVNPSEWSYKDIQNYVLNLEAQGFEIALLMLDYLSMLPTKGCETGAAGHDVRDMFKRMRNFCSARKITLLTPHQLSTDAVQLVREGRNDIVKQVVGGNFYAGSKQIPNELDGELFLHIEKLNKRAYFTIQRGKHRIPTVIQEDEKYMVLPFPVEGSIPDDLNKAEITCKKVGGGPIGSTEETPFWDYVAAETTMSANDPVYLRRMGQAT